MSTIDIKRQVAEEVRQAIQKFKVQYLEVAQEKAQLDLIRFRIDNLDKEATDMAKQMFFGVYRRDPVNDQEWKRYYNAFFAHGPDLIAMIESFGRNPEALQTPFYQDHVQIYNRGWHAVGYMGESYVPAAISSLKNRILDWWTRLKPLMNQYNSLDSLKKQVEDRLEVLKLELNRVLEQARFTLEDLPSVDEIMRRIDANEDPYTYKEPEPAKLPDVVAVQMPVETPKVEYKPDNKKGLVAAAIGAGLLYLSMKD